MPRMPDYIEMRSDAMAAYRYSDMCEYGYMRISNAGDRIYVGIDLDTGTNPLGYSIEIPAGTPVFSLYTDGMAPWATAEAFYQYHGYHPEDWSMPEEEAYCSHCEEPLSYCSCENYENEDYYSIESTDDPDALESPLQIPALPDRPVRCMSMEIEVGRGGSYLAEQFHEAGLAIDPYMHGYHSSSEYGFVRVEEDASVAAEIIFDKMYLSRPGHAEKLERGLKILRKAIKGEQSKLDMRCGLHIHIGVNRDRSAKTAAYTHDNLTSLYHLWNYLEDTIFRLGSANWRGHRSQHGNSYSPVTPKGVRLDLNGYGFGRCALNFSNILNYMRYGSDGRGGTPPTVEFRVFNTSANQRKIRAYAAMCQALVAFAQDNEVTNVTHPVFAWTANDEPDVEASKERLDFILNRLPLTNAERADILYCAERSSLKVCL